MVTGLGVSTMPPVPGPGLIGGGGAVRLASGIGVVVTGLWAHPPETRVKAAPTKKILTKLEVFIVISLFGEAVTHLAQAGWEQLPES